MEYWHFWKTSDIYIFEEKTFRWMPSFLFPFCLFLFSPILIHYYLLRYFSSGEVDTWTRIIVIPGGYIIFHSHLLLLNYLHIFSLSLLNMYDSALPFTASYAAARRKIFLDDCWLTFSRRKPYYHRFWFLVPQYFQLCGIICSWFLQPWIQKILGRRQIIPGCLLLFHYGWGGVA